MKLLYLLLFILLTPTIQAQITGTVINKESGKLLDDIPIEVSNAANNERLIIFSDSLGKFQCNPNKEGNYTISVSAMGYQEVRFDNLIVTPGRVLFLEIALEQKHYSLDEVVVVPSAWGVNKTNEISSYEINPHLMNITVGSSYDILRSATLIPGVSNTSDASNDLNIRGNSPFGINWYIEDAPVVSPNHFTDNNSSSGVFSIFNAWGVNKSQLFVSAFPAEYGNAISGVMNTELRTGNFQKLQGNINISTINAGALLETPIKKGKSSIIGGFRYSFPNLIHKAFPTYSKRLGTVPDILDGFLKFHSLINPNLKVSLWAIGGNSDAAFKYDAEDNQVLSLKRGGSSVSSGLSVNYSKNTISLKTNIYTSHRNNKEYVVSKHAINSEAGWTGINTKLSIRNSKSKILLGADFKRQYYNQYRDIFSLAKDSIHTAHANDFSSFFTYSYHFKNHLSLQVGMHYWYSDIAEEHRFEPRAKLRQQLGTFGSVSMGFGEHSINSPVQYLYSYEQKEDDNGNKTVSRNKVLMPLMKSRHFVLGWNKRFKSGIKIESEAFYQHLYDASNKVLSKGYTHYPYAYGGITLGAPETPPSTFATGRNYGVELSLDAPFPSKNMYFYLAGVLFNSEYKYNNSKWTPTLFNSNYSITSAFRKEFILSKKAKLAASLNYIAQGGRRYTPIDKEQTEKYKQMIYDNDRINACKRPYYGRLDASLSLNTSSKKLSHSFTLEVQNVLNRENILERYDYYSIDPVVINQVKRVFVYKYTLSF